LTRMIAIAAIIFGAGLVSFGFSHWLWLSLVLLAFVGFGMMQGMTASNTIIQTLVPEEKRGRVMSYYMAAFVGMGPFGSLLAGSLAHWMGAPRTVMVTGSFCIAGGIWFWTQLPAIRKEMRPVYERLGIIAPLPKAVEEQAAN
jgi:MFS family permease